MGGNRARADSSAHNEPNAPFESLNQGLPRAPPLGAPSRAEPEMRDGDSSPERPWDDDPGFDFDQSDPEG